MKQRVGIARGFAIEPKVLLMDEPFSAIDEQTREIMQEEALKIMVHEKKTVVFITHSIDEAVFLSSRIFLMSVRPGQIVEEVKIDIPYPRTLERKFYLNTRNTSRLFGTTLKGKSEDSIKRGKHDAETRNLGKYYCSFY